MPRKSDRKQISFTVSAVQHADFLYLAERRGMAPAEYMRWLLELDAKELGAPWSSDLPERGKYPRVTKCAICGGEFKPYDTKLHGLNPRTFRRAWMHDLCAIEELEKLKSRPDRYEKYIRRSEGGE